jgi:hypothetical protein
MTELLRVEIESVNSSQSRSSFSEADLDLIADRILESGGLLKPLVLKKIGFEKYDVVDGHFEYYAAVRAYEKNPHASEVNALIISPEREDVVIKQVEALKGLSLPKQQSKTPTDTTNSDFQLTNIELRIEKQSNDFRAELSREIQRLEDKFKKIESQIPQKVEPLESLNSLNQDELAVRLERSRIIGAEKIAKAIVDARHEKKQQKFEDYRDVVKSVKGLGEKTILTIIDAWSRS